jgi:hypothetical protein
LAKINFTEQNIRHRITIHLVEAFIIVLVLISVFPLTQLCSESKKATVVCCCVRELVSEAIK